MQPLTDEQYKLETMQRNADRNIANERKRAAARLDRVIRNANKTAFGSAMLATFGAETIANLKRR